MRELVGKLLEMWHVFNSHLDKIKNAIIIFSSPHKRVGIHSLVVFDYWSVVIFLRSEKMFPRKWITDSSVRRQTFKPDSSGPFWRKLARLSVRGEFQLSSIS